MVDRFEAFLDEPVDPFEAFLDEPEDMPPPQRGSAPRSRLTRQRQNRRGQGRSAGIPIADAGRLAFQGLTLNAGDEIIAGVKSLGSETYDEALDYERRKLEAAREANPAAALALEVVGGLPLALAPGANVAKGLQSANKFRQAVTGFGVGAAYGGVSGFNDGEGGLEDRTARGGQGALFGGLFGSGGAYLSGSAGRYLQRRAQRRADKAFTKAAPTAEQLKADAGRIYDTIDARLSPDAMGRIAGRLEGVMDAEGFTPGLRSGQMKGLIKTFRNVADDPTGSADAKIARQQINILAGSNKPQVGRLGKMLKGEFDDALSGLKQSDLASGDVSTINRLSEANDLYRRGKKAEMIEDAFGTGSRQASGFENGLRIELRKILNSETRRRQFSADEIAAMEKVVQGTATTNTLKKLSRLGFGDAQQTNTLGGSLPAGAGAILGSSLGPAGVAVGFAAPGAIGKLSSLLNNRLQGSRADLVRAMAAQGNVPPRVAKGRLSRMLQLQGAPITGAMAGDQGAMIRSAPAPQARALQPLMAPRSERRSEH